MSEGGQINCEPSLGSAHISFSLAFCFVLHATADVSRALISFFVRGLATWQHCIQLRACAHLRMKVQRVIYHVQCLMGFAMHTWICCSRWSLFVVVFFSSFFLQPQSCNWSVCILGAARYQKKVILLTFFLWKKKKRGAGGLGGGVAACLPLLCYNALYT